MIFYEKIMIFFYDFFMAPRDLPPSCLAFGPLLPSLKPLTRLSRASATPLPNPFQRLERGSRCGRPGRPARRGLGRGRERPEKGLLGRGFEKERPLRILTCVLHHRSFQLCGPFCFLQPCRIHGTLLQATTAWPSSLNQNRLPERQSLQ